MKPRDGRKDQRGTETITAAPALFLVSRLMVLPREKAAAAYTRGSTSVSRLMVSPREKTAAAYKRGCIVRHALSLATLSLNLISRDRWQYVLNTVLIGVKLLNLS